jgi:hypothetical protein
VSDISRLEKIIDDITDLRDDQTTIDCPPSGDCICNYFDRAADELRVVMSNMCVVLKDDLVTSLAQLEAPEDRHERQGVLEQIARLEARIQCSVA